MSITEKYESLLAEVRDLQAQIAHVSRGDYAAHQRRIDSAGARVIEFERAHKIDEARDLHEHAKFVLPQLEQNGEMLAHYTGEPLPIDVSVATSEEIERATSERSTLLFEVRKAVKTLSRMRDDIVARRKKIPVESMAIAEKRDELSGYERTIFEEHYLNTRVERVTNSVLQDIYKPKELAAA